ncbi:Reverse transcriptase RNA-dependent DNA polymerase [Arabidopsis suecica]|uniref:Reverse transcriptase RNA-dependent DNA polymerase n=1 Tax=Arabidopsis suecica TaxID=45249 RepID=A0A8T2CQZ6_ARASU|nr:Reverse transcriptase RNA-dependent DNA polymerase [Arabidopsis suecica]
MITHAKKGIIKPNSKYVMAISKVDIEPRKVIQTLADDKWRDAMSEEFDAQLLNFTWSLVPPAPNQNLELKQFFISVGFTNSLADASLFILKRGSLLLYLLVYVDDILVTSNSHALLQQTLQSLATHFSIKDPEDLHYFLGLEGRRTQSGLYLTQRCYILDLLTRCNMLDAKPVMTPIAASSKLSLFSGTSLSDPSEYRTVIRSLQYLTFTRPDISYAVNRLSQFMHKPTNDHWQAAKLLLRYLADTSYHGIFFHWNNTNSIHAFSDADWAGDTDNYVSTHAISSTLARIQSHDPPKSKKEWQGPQLKLNTAPSRTRLQR